MYVGREILNNGVKAAFQLRLEFSSLYSIDFNVIHRCIVNQHYTTTAQLCQKPSFDTRGHTNATKDQPDILPHNGDKFNDEGTIMIGEFLLENAVETARLRKRDVLKKKYEANLKCYIEYKLKQFYRGILAEYMINNKKGGLEATHL